MSFGWPLVLLALAVVPAALALAVVLARRPSRYPVAFTNLEVLAPFVERRRNWRPWLPLSLFLLALATATTALARPHLDLRARSDHATIVLLVDVSGSMRATDVEPTRLDAATDAIRRFLDRVPARFQVGLVQFSAAPDVLSLPTTDRAAVRGLLDYLEADAGTAIGDGLAAATQLVRDSLAAGRAADAAGDDVPGAIILLSDGTQSTGRLPALAGAQRAREAGVRVETVALGTAQGVLRVPPGTVLLPVPPDPPLMRAIARRTGGHTFTAETAPRLADVFDDLGSSIGRRTKRTDVTSWFAFGAALLLLGALASSELLASPLD